MMYQEKLTGRLEIHWRVGSDEGRVMYQDNTLGQVFPVGRDWASEEEIRQWLADRGISRAVEGGRS